MATVEMFRVVKSWSMEIYGTVSREKCAMSSSSIADGITKLGLDKSALALRYLIVGLIVMFIRGIVTERIYLAMRSKNA